MPDIVTIILFGAISLLAAAAGMFATGRLLEMRSSPRSGRAGPVFADTPRRYEFREGYLLSQMDPNDSFLPGDVDRSAAFDALARALKPLNRDLPGRLTGLARRGEAFVLSGRFGHDTLSVAGRPDGDRIIVTIGPTDADSGRQVVEAAVLDALRREAEYLRNAVDASRVVMWRQEADGPILWANAPYFALVERLGGHDRGGVSWPVRALFSEALKPPPEAGTLRRLRIVDRQHAGPDHDASDEVGSWYEIAANRQTDGTLICTALPIDRLVAAETSLRNFVQTLSKTFAYLPTGLAIFDRRRELMLFNPSLVSLSGLDPQFLSSRPSLVAFLDALRDRQRMPEPKNYRHWRDEIARLEQDAEAGTYQELWSLPTGQSYRVIGRPHPDGAVALMFEDITSEVALTRKFRGDLELYRALFDDLEPAITVFSGEGRLVLANAAYRALWGVEAADQIDSLSLTEATRHWQKLCRPSGLWGDIRAFADHADHKVERSDWSESVTRADGTALAVRVAPLSGGAISVTFESCGTEASRGDTDTGMSAPDPAATEPGRSSTATNRCREMAEPAAPYRARDRREV